VSIVRMYAPLAYILRFMTMFVGAYLTVEGGRLESDMEEEEDDDAEYYRQEVGEEPDPGMCVCVHAVITLSH